MKTALELIQDLGNFGIWQFDLASDTLIWDDKMFSIYEVERSQFNNHINDFRQLVHPEDAPEVESSMQTVMDGSRISKINFRIITPGGKLKYIEGNVKLAKDEPGRSIILIGINRDVTDDMLIRAEVEATNKANLKLLKEYQKLSIVSQQTSNMVLITDKEGATEWVNDAFIRYTGYTLAEVKGLKPGKLLQGPLTAQAEVRKMRKAIKQQREFNVELINYNKAGQAYWVQIKANPYFINGRFEGFVSIQTDTTEQKKIQEEILASQQQYEAIFQGTLNAVLLCDDSGNYINANNAALQMLEYTKEELLLMNAKDLVAEDEDMYLKMVSEFKRQSSAVGIMRLRKKSGGIIYVEYKSTANILKGIHMSVLMDITDRLEYLQQINNQNKVFKTIAEYQSHHLRKPVANILGLVDLMAQIEMCPDNKKLFGMLKQNTDDLDTIIKDIVFKASSADFDSFLDSIRA